MAFNEVNRASTSFITSSCHGRVDGSRFVRDQGRTARTHTGPKSGGHSQSRVSCAGGVSSQERDANKSTHLIPSQNDSSHVFRRLEGSRPNHLDLAIQQSSEGSDGEWEEVSCTTTIVDRPLHATPSGSTLPTPGRRSEILTLEVSEDGQPPSLASESHTINHITPLSEYTEHHLTRGLADERDDYVEADQHTPVPCPSRQPQAHNPDAVDRVAKSSLPVQLPVHLQEVFELPGRVRNDHNPPSHKPRVSFKEKATELTRVTGRLPAPSKLLPPRDPTINPLSRMAAGGTLSFPNESPRPCTQAASDPLSAGSKLFTSKVFSHHVQSFRKRQKEETRQQFRERYGEIVVARTRCDPADLMAECASTRSPDQSKGVQPTQGTRARKNTNGKRVTKARAEAEGIKKICRATKSYIVDMEAIKRRGPPTLSGLQRPSPTTTFPCPQPPCARTEKPTRAIPSQRGPLPVPELPSQLLPTSLGGVPQGLKFARKRASALEPEEAATVTSPKQEIHRLRLPSSSGHNGPGTMGGPKRRLKDSGTGLDPSVPRKKPRLGRR